MNNKNFKKPSYAELEARIEKLESDLSDYQSIFPVLKISILKDVVEFFGNNLASQNILKNSDYTKSEQIKFLSMNMNLREHCVFLHSDDYRNEVSYINIKGQKDTTMQFRRNFNLPKSMDDFSPLFTAYSNLFPNVNKLSTAFVKKLIAIRSVGAIGKNSSIKEFEIAVMLLFFFEMPPVSLSNMYTQFDEEKILQELEYFK